jgi:hypothetical protein
MDGAVRREVSGTILAASPWLADLSPAAVGKPVENLVGSA